MMKRKFIFIAVLAFLSGSFKISAYTEDGSDGFREALRLMDRGLTSRATSIFLAEDYSQSKGYDILCDVQRRTEGYEAPMLYFLRDNPHLAIVPQIKYEYALNLFDDGNFKAAYEIWDSINLRHLRPEQRTECVFKKAYCCLENHMVSEALVGFEEVEKLPVNDFTMPSRYILGYINYEMRSFEKALLWFEKSREDSRFREISNYFIMECRFMLGDYEYVAANAKHMIETVPLDRKQHAARLISESLLVLG
jgi:tetratricopeptide (TPR) repeat protein